MKTFSYREWTQEDFSILANTLEVENISEEYQERLVEIYVRYAIDRTEKLPRKSDAKKYLRSLDRDVKKLIETLNERNELADQELILSILKRNMSRDFVLSLGADLERLSKNIKVVLHALPKDSGGHTGQWSLKSLIVALGKAYEEVTGKRPTVSYNDNNKSEIYYESRFLIFVRAFLDISEFNEDIPANDAFGKLAQRALKAVVK